MGAEGRHHLGGADELRALLPRCLELAVAGTPRLPLRWVTAKLRHTGWLGWPPTEQQAVADVLVALWDDVLDGDTGYHDAGGAVLAVAEAIDDVGPFLATWHERCGGAGRERALRHLARFIVAYRGELTADVLPAQVQAWVRGPTTRIQLDRAIFDFGGTPLSEAAAAAIAVIDELGPVPT